MKLEKLLFYFSILLLLLTVCWIIFMAMSMGEYAPLIENLEEALEFVKNPGKIFYINYITVIVLTFVNTIFFALLYLYFKKDYPILAISGILFVPVYTAYNLFAYTSQISLVRTIQHIYTSPGYANQVSLLLSQLVQAWNNSATAFINNYAYAILGIPSITFGMAFLKGIKISRITGWLFILDGITCLIGIIGIISTNRLLSLGSTIGGVFFLLFLVFSAITFYKKC